MSWGKVDDRAPEHPKFISLNDAGWSLWIRALLHACRYRTDGFLDPTVVRRMGSMRTARELVRRRLWEPVKGGGFVIHDFLQYQLGSNGQRPADLHDKRAEAGKRGAAARWGREDDDDDGHPRPPRAGMANDGKTDSKPMANLPFPNGKFATPEYPSTRVPDKDKSKTRVPDFTETGPIFRALSQVLKRNAGET